MEKQNNKKLGFTLIELLVVIAITGILASVVLLRYPLTIKRVKDTRVVSALSQFRTQAAVFFEIQQDFGLMDCSLISGVCTCSDRSLDILCKDAQKNSDQDLIIRRAVNLRSYCVVGHLQDDNEYFCVDGKYRANRYTAFPLTCQAGCEDAPQGCSCE